MRYGIGFLALFAVLAGGALGAPISLSTPSVVEGPLVSVQASSPDPLDPEHEEAIAKLTGLRA
jgi:hypothetical protein